MSVFNKLPVPYTYNGTKIEYFQPNELELSDIKKVSNLQNKRNFPMTWIAETVCRSISHMGGVNVFDEFSKDIENIPPVVLAMPMVSTSNVLVAGHIQTLGEILTDVPMRCPNTRCNNEEEIKLNLLGTVQPELGFSYEDFKIEAKIDKELGYKVSEKAAQAADIPPDSKFNNFVFRLPTIKDTLDCQDVFNFDDPFDFMCKLLSVCIVGVSTDEGFELPTNLLTIHKDRIIPSLKPRAMKELIGIHKKATPEYELKTNHVCSKCQTKFSFSVDNSFLFQMV